MRMKRFTAAVITAGMLAGAVYIPAFAAETVGTEEELRAAVSSAASGDVITLSGNITLKSGIDITGGQDIKIDLAGHTLTGAFNTYAIRINGNCKLNILDGIIEVGDYDFATSDGWSCGIDNRGGVVTADEVTFKGGYDAGNAVNVSNDGINYATTTLTDVTVEKNYGDGSFGIVVQNTNNVLNIKSGEVNCPVIADGGTLNIYEGIYQGAVTNNNGVVNISGGKFYKITDSSADKTKLKVTGGDFSAVDTINGWVIPEGTDINITLNNARLTNFQMYSGSIGGTVKVSPSDIFFGSEVAVSDSLVNSINSKLQPDKMLVRQGDGTWEIIDADYVEISVAADPEAAGTALVSKGGSAVYGMASRKINVGDTATLWITNSDEYYDFKGWYNGDSLISENQTYTFTVGSQADNKVTYTARFELDPEFAALGESTKNWLGDYGTTTAYTITSKEDMACLAYAVNVLGHDFSGKTVELTSNITYAESDSYTPVGTQSNAFAGTFDGKEHTISGISLTSDGYYIGIFGNASGEIKNLKTSKCSFTSNNTNANARVGVIAGEGRKFTNCTVADSLAVSTGSLAYAGIICGHSEELTAENIKVTGCTLSGGFKNGAVAGYTNSCTIRGAEVSGLKPETPAAAMTGALIGHKCNGNAELSNINVTAPNYSLIGTAYESSNAVVTINGNSDNKIEVKNITGDIGGLSALNITGGKYTLEGMLGTGSGDPVSVSGGVFDIDVLPYLADKCAVSNEKKGLYTVYNTDDHNTLKEGSYRSALTVNNTYDQMDIFTKSLEDLFDGKVIYTIKTNTGKSEDVTINYGTIANGEGAAVIGLIVADIPAETQITVTLIK